MTTPRIEEEIDEIIDALVADVHFEKTWPAHTAYYQIDLNQFQEKLRQALTQAHQAGRDEAVEEAVAIEKQLRDIHKIELDTISCMSLEQFVVWSDQRKQPKDDIIKALQDNK